MKAAAGGLAGVALPPLALAGCSGGDSGASLAATALTDTVSLLPGAPGNVLALATSEGAVLVDTGGPEQGQAVVNSVRGAIHTAFNTHYHRDQTGGNEAVTSSGARLVAHERTRLRLAVDQWRRDEMRWEPARPEAAQPTETFYTTDEMSLGGETIAYGHLLHAHTDGDIYVFFRDANVLAAGDVLAPDRDPVFDWFAGGWMGGRVDSLALLLELADEDTQIVPAYGPVMTYAELEAEHALMSSLFERVHQAFRQGRSAEDMLREGVLDGLGREFNDPDKLLYDIYKGLWGHQSSMSPDIV